MSSTTWLVLAGLAVVAAVVFAVGVGRPVTRPPGWRGRFARWGHTVVWLLLAATFLALAIGPPIETLAPPLGLAALATYGLYLASLVGAARR